MSWGDCWYWRDMKLIWPSLGTILCHLLWDVFSIVYVVMFAVERESEQQWREMKVIFEKMHHFPATVHPFFIHFSHHLSLHHFIPILDPVFFILLPFWVLREHVQSSVQHLVTINLLTDQLLKVTSAVGTHNPSWNSWPYTLKLAIHLAGGAAHQVLSLPGNSIAPLAKLYL